MPPDPVRQTSCKNCLFAVYTDKTQTGCIANRIEKFGNEVIEAYDDSKEFYVIDRLCNLFRSESWNNGEADLEKAKIESYLDFDLIVNCDDINTEYQQQFIALIDNIKYPFKKLSIVLYHSYKAKQETKQMILEIFKRLKHIKVSIVYEKFEFLQSEIDKSSRSFHIAIDIADSKNLYGFFEALNNEVNENLQKCILFKMNDTYAISNAACRLIYTNFYGNFLDNLERIKSDCTKAKLYIDKNHESKNQN
jgi:hypothetical protein